MAGESNQLTIGKSNIGKIFERRGAWRHEPFAKKAHSGPILHRADPIRYF